MAENRGLQCLMRLLCGLIDCLLVLLPVQLLMLGVMQRDAAEVDILFRLLFAVYGAVMIEYCEGATVGKRFGRLMVVDRAGGKAPMLYVGLRELVRSMYLIPVAGWIAGAVSVVMMLAAGRTLHDLVGNTMVIYRWQYQRPETEDEDEPG